MDQPAIKSWLEKNKYLLATFIMLLLVTISLCVYVFTVNLPTIFYYLGQGGFSYEEQSLLAAEDLNPKPGQKVANISGKAYNQLRASAKKTAYIEIGDCKPYPAISHITINSTIGLKNSTKNTHVISLQDGRKYTVQAHEKIIIPTSFPHVPSLYTFSCDNSRSPLGAFWVTE